MPTATCLFSSFCSLSSCCCFPSLLVQESNSLEDTLILSSWYYCYPYFQQLLEMGFTLQILTKMNYLYQIKRKIPHLVMKVLSSLRNRTHGSCFTYFCLSVFVLHSLSGSSSRAIFTPEDATNNYPSKRIRRPVAWDSKYSIHNYNQLIYHFPERWWSILPLRLKNDQEGRLTDEKLPSWQWAGEEGTKNWNINHNLQNYTTHKTNCTKKLHENK